MRACTGFSWSTLTSVRFTTDFSVKSNIPFKWIWIGFVLALFCR